MKLKFIDSYAEATGEGFKRNHEYDFVDMRKANYFIDHGLALPVEEVIEAVTKTKGKRKNEMVSDNAK